MKRSFTLLEIIFVIVVIGILSATIVSHLSDDRKIDAANQILSHIRFAQHLALIDDKFDSKKGNWYKEYWQIRFFKKQNASSDGTTAKWAYAVFSDKNFDGNPNATIGEVALDPLTGKLISGGFTIQYSDPKTYKKAAIEETYNITDVLFSSSCQYYGSKRIIFDNIGRPYRGNPKNYDSPYPKNRILKNRCTITFCFDGSCDTNFSIAIEPETGFAYIII